MAGRAARNAARPGGRYTADGRRGVDAPPRQRPRLPAAAAVRGVAFFVRPVAVAAAFLVVAAPGRGRFHLTERRQRANGQRRVGIPPTIPCNNRVFFLQRSTKAAGRTSINQSTATGRSSFVRH